MSTITVLTPAYNAAATIQQALDSVVSARHMIQHIVIDDASTDDTAAIAAARGAHVIRLAENGGPAAALNAAIEHISGEYVITLEADDTFHFDAIDRLESLMSFGAGFAYGWTKYYGRSLHVHRPRIPANPMHFYDRLESLYAVMFRREALKRGGARWHTFQAGYGLHDWDFVLQLVAMGYLPDVYRGLVLHYDYKTGSLNSLLETRNSEFLAELKARHPLVRAERI